MRGEKLFKLLKQETIVATGVLEKRRAVFEFPLDCGIEELPQTA